MKNQDDTHRKRRPKAGDIGALQRVLWRSILLTEEVLLTADTAELRLRAANSLAQAAAHYGKLCETVDLAARVSQLEEALKRGGRA